MTGRKLEPKVLLEGTRLTLKTEIAFALNEHPRMVGPRRYRYHSPVISAEWCAFTPWPWGRGPINFAPEEEGRAMETFATWARLFELLPHYSWIVDRFHLSARVHQWIARGVDLDFAWLEQKLKPLGFHLVLCVRRPDAFARAREARLRVSGNPAQYDDLGAFVREQEVFDWMAAQSSLPVLRLDVSDDDVEGAADHVARWMDETGGLWGAPLLAPTES